MTKSKDVRFAILGAGVAADYHRQAVAANEAQGARLSAVGHYDPSRYDEISARFGAPCVPYETILSDPDVDCVCICTPSGQHEEQAVKAAVAGKHVLVEKPMALTLDGADRMIGTCAEAGVHLGVVLQRRATPLFEGIKEAVAAGHLGELTLGAVTLPYYRPESYYGQAEWRGTWAMDGGGVLMNQGIHLVDLLVWMMGDPVETTAYAGTLARDIEVEDTLAAVLRFAGGAVATITATTTTRPGFPHRLELYGTEGGIQLEGETIRRWELGSVAGPAPDLPSEGGVSDAGAAAGPRGISPTGHITIVRDFMEAVRRDRAPLVDGMEGRRSLEAVLAIYHAAGLTDEKGDEIRD
jgi:predicted dehydrogenase